MKKEICAVLLLAALTFGAVLNVHHVEKLTAELKLLAEYAENAALNGDYEAAHRSVNDAIELWQCNDRYTHIFIAHAETDALADCFFEAAGALNDAAGREELRAAFEKLLYHLDSLTDMERVKPGSIF